MLVVKLCLGKYIVDSGGAFRTYDLALKTVILS
jgi:hypothetical protein